LSEGRPSFIAYASDPSLGEEPVSGHIYCDLTNLNFQSEQLALQMPLRTVVIDMMEPKDGRIYFSDPNLPDVFVYTFDQRILNYPALLHHLETRRQIEALCSRGELKRRLVVTGAFFGAIIIITCLISVITGIMVRSLVARIPPEFEQEWGDAALAEFQQTETFVQDPKLQQRVDQALAPLIKVLPTNHVAFRSYVVSDPVPNAFALPGGHVLVTTGLLDLAERPEHISGVVAHEVAHVTLKHQFRQAISGAGPFLIFRLFLGGKGLVGLLGDSSELVVRQSFSQSYELEADATGWDYLVSAHIDPRGLGEMLRKLQAEDKKHGDGPELRAFSSHPPTDKRILRLESKWKKLKNKSEFST
jgi:predicted Zn-dependent protease